MKRYILTSILYFVGLFVFAQGHRVEFLIQDLPDQKVYLSRYYLSDYQVIDSANSMNGSFYFYAEEDQPGAMYRLNLERSGRSGGQENSGLIEFLWAGESFQVYTEYSRIAEALVFENSEENSLLDEFRRYEILYERKMSALSPLIDRYPEEDEFYKGARKQFIRLQEERDSVIQALAGSNPDRLAAKIIKSYRSNIIQPGLRGNERLEYIQEHYFDLSPIDDPALLYAPVYNLKVIEYLKLFRSQTYSFSDQESAFIEAVDLIMANVSGDVELRKFIVDYLLEGFQSFGMEKIQTYIVDTYLDETCETDAMVLAKHRVEGYKKMAEGQIAADIYIRSSEDKMVRLSEVNSEYTLVIFWATYCEHCRELMPKLVDWYNAEKPPNIEVFSISIDTVKSAWDAYIDQVDPPWICTHEPMGWEGKSAEDYNIYATPTMFLLDRERRIIAKPYTFRELKREVGKL